MVNVAKGVRPPLQGGRRPGAAAALVWGLGILADFEGLIRQALARQNDADPEIREKVYQSSRRALAKMIAGAGVQPPEIINRQRLALENAIERIEAAYGPPLAAPSAQAPRAAPHPSMPAQPGASQTRPPAARPAPEPVPVRPQPPRPAPPPVAPHAAPAPETGPDHGGFDHLPGIAAEPDDRIGADADDLAPPRQGRRVLLFAMALASILVVGFLLYLLYRTLYPEGLSWPAGDPAPQAEQSSSRPETPLDPPPADGPSSYVVILSGEDTAALETAGRGRAEIVSQANVDLIRLVSLRDTAAIDEPADPMLLKIDGGIIPGISGRSVVVEIQAKSGTVGPANFAVGCVFAGADICGRKRFTVGIQPEAVVFTIDVPEGLDDRDEAHLTISTDIVADPETGEGDPVDIEYARLRVSR